MKELTIEQKAKAYDEAIERAKVFKEHLLEINDKGYADEMDYIFPELAESEDEKIRKAIKYGLDRVFTNNTTVFEVTKEQCLSWLEKQGEHTSVTDLRTWKYIADYVVTKWCGIGQYLDSPRLTTIAEELQRKYYLEQKQCEQKSAEWSEKDKMQLDAAIHLVSSTGHIETTNWLKDLKNRVLPQPKQEWGEEDEMMIKFTLTYFRTRGALENSDIIKWLKKLKSRIVSK